jgi:hypothetical protein
MTTVFLDRPRPPTTGTVTMPSGPVLAKGLQRYRDRLLPDITEVRAPVARYTSNLGPFAPRQTTFWDPEGPHRCVATAAILT